MTLAILIGLQWGFEILVALVGSWYPTADGRDRVALTLTWIARAMAATTIAGSLAAAVAFWGCPSGKG